MFPESLPTSRRVRLAPAILWALVVLVASVVDPGSGGLATTGPLGLVGLDKWLHVGAYATLSFLLAGGLAARSVRLLAVAAVLAAAYGAGVEAVQYPLAARSGDVLDGTANGLGAVLGVATWATLAAITGRMTEGRSGAENGDGRP